MGTPGRCIDINAKIKYLYSYSTGFTVVVINLIFTIFVDRTVCLVYRTPDFSGHHHDGFYWMFHHYSFHSRYMVPITKGTRVAIIVCEQWWNRFRQRGKLNIYRPWVHTVVVNCSDDFIARLKFHLFRHGGSLWFFFLLLLICTCNLLNYINQLNWREILMSIRKMLIINNKC